MKNLKIRGENHKKNENLKITKENQKQIKNYRIRLKNLNKKNEIIEFN